MIKINDISLEIEQRKLRSSKDDTFNKGFAITIYKNFYFLSSWYNAQYIELRRKSGTIVENNTCKFPLSRNNFISILGNLLKRFGYDDSTFSGHSFRIWAATSTASSGVQDHVIHSRDSSFWLTWFYPGQLNPIS